MCFGAVLDLIVIAHQSYEVHMLFQRLYDLCQKLFETMIVSDDGEAVAEQILASFFHGCRDGK